MPQLLRAGSIGAVSFPIVSHPTLGTAPRSLQAGFPDAAARLRADRTRLAARALEVAVDADPSIRTRHDDAALRNLLRDAEVLVDRLALCVAGDDPHWLREFAEQSAPVFRRRKLPVDDVREVCEGIRAGVRGVLSDEEMAPATRALDEAVAVYAWYRRIRGDARRWNPVTSRVYKGI